MYLSILKKTKITIFLSLLVLTTSCTSRYCGDEESIEIPCCWQTPIGGGMTVEEPSCFLWWSALDDSLLTALIEQVAYANKDVRLAAFQSQEKVLETVNGVASEFAKTYIELRGLQNRSKVLQSNIEAQKEILILNEGLSTKGFFSLSEQNENKKNLDYLFLQKTAIDFSINKAIFHLSTLIGELPGTLYSTLECPQELPELPCNVPIGLPMDIIRRNPTIQVATKEYEMSRNIQAFYNYQKTLLSILEEAETALAAFHSALNKNYYLAEIKRLKSESYLLAKDLYSRGLKDERDLLQDYQALLIEEDAFIQGKVDLLINYVSLYQVLGTCWEYWRCCINNQ